MTRIAGIAVVAAMVLMLGSMALAQGSGSEAPGSTGAPGPAPWWMASGWMSPWMMAAWMPHPMWPGAEGMAWPWAGTLTPQQQVELTKAWIEQYIQRFLPGYTLEKKKSG